MHTPDGSDLWEAFIDSLWGEWSWKTLIGVSAVSTSAILTILTKVAVNPITRIIAFLSLISALMSLSFGSIYIVKFGTMKSMYRSSRWDEEVRRASNATWWNVWVLLAMPAVSTAWSMLLLLASILSFVWLNGSDNDPNTCAPLRETADLGPRVAVTGVLVLGLVFIATIVKTLKRYGRELSELRADVEISLGAVPVLGGEPEERGTEP